MRVLLLEDNRGDAALVLDALRQAAPGAYTVAHVETLAEALSVVHSCDAALLDLDVPDSRGVATVGAVAGAAPGMPIVALTGHAGDLIAEQALELGAQDYIVKGQISPSQLAQALRSATWRKSMVDALAESERRFRSLFDNAPVALRSAGPDAGILEASDAFALLTGRDLLDLVGATPPEIVHPDDRHVEDAALAAARSGEVPSCRYAVRLVRPDGSVRNVQVVASAVAASGAAGAIGYTSCLYEDVTDRLQALAEVAFRARLLDAVAEAVVAWDGDGTITYWNRAARDLFQGAPGSMGRDLLAATSVDVALTRAPVTEGGRAELTIETDRGRRQLLAARTTVRDAAGGVEAVAAVATDVTELKRAQHAVAASEERFRTLVQGLSDVISILDGGGAVTYSSPSGLRLVGAVRAEEIVGQSFTAKLHVEDCSRVVETMRRWLEGLAEPVRYRVRHADGSWVHCESVGVNLFDDPAVRGVVVTTRDISEREEAAQRLAHQAMHDALTGLPNRTLFTDRLTQALQRAERENQQILVLFVDLDNFKAINDSHGHLAGDEVLVAVAELLSTCVRAGDTVSRFGGDEFAIISEDTRGPDHVHALAERVLDVLRAPFGVSGHHVHVSASVGVAIGGGGARTTAADMLRDAGTAMYRAKELGRGRVEVFDEALRQRALRRAQLEELLRGAVPKGELSVVYQPVGDISTGRVTGFEALLRWGNDVVGDVSPSEFIPIAEATDLTRAIGRWVLDEACRQLATWRTAHPAHSMTMAVNLSVRQLADPALVDMVASAIRRHAIDPGQLCLEVTESVVMEDAGASAATLRRLKGLGIRIAIDDFGTGYSSLAYLKRFPVDCLKIDRSFVAGLGRDQEDTIIVACVIDLAKRLDIDAIAEGVEDQEQLDQLHALGCAAAQGFLWSHPVAATEAEHFIGATVAKARAAGTAKVADEPPPRQRPSRDPGVAEVVSLLTHELRTPLTVIKGFAETMGELMSAGHTDILETALAAIQRQADGMEAVMSALGDMQAIERGTLHLDLVRVPLLATVADIVADLQRAVPDRALVLLGGDDAEVELDVHRLRQIVSNLVGNAVKHGPPEAPVRVLVGAERDVAVIRVVDTGPGVPEGWAPQLFRKFSMADRSQKGTGLGLYLVRSLARAHGGEAGHRRPATGGAEFSVTLPIAPATTRGCRGGQEVAQREQPPARGAVSSP